MTGIATTIDGLLNRRVLLEQPAEGYRVAVDTVFLAAAVPALAGDRIMDLGCGVGGAMLALACRVAGVKGVGIDIQPELIDLCRRNIGRNIFASGLEAYVGNATSLFARDKFDHVLMNPPYHEESRHDVSDNSIKYLANAEKEGDLNLWISAAAAVLDTGGVLTMIHRADRRSEILSILQKNFGGMEIMHLLPKIGAEAKRVIVRARKDAFFSIRECRPLVLHREDGGYTEEADEILRSAQAVVFQSP